MFTYSYQQRGSEDKSKQTQSTVEKSDDSSSEKSEDKDLSKENKEQCQKILNVFGIKDKNPSKDDFLIVYNKLYNSYLQQCKGLKDEELDECEKKPSGHCPYFTNPHPPVTTPGTGKNITEDFTTNVRLPNGNTVPLDPFVYGD